MSAIAYLAGVMKGDGWCTDKAMGLRVADQDFSQAFADALTEVFDGQYQPKLDERGYWLIRRRNRCGKYSLLNTFEPMSETERRMWLRGLFDSEGNAYLHCLGGESYDRKIAIYSSNETTIKRATRYLSELGMTTKCRIRKKLPGVGWNSDTPKTMYELRLAGSRENYTAFARLVSSNIERKRTVIEAIPSSYQQDFSEHCRKAQKLGAVAKKRKTMEETLPSVVEGICELIRSGTKPTQANCRIVPGFTSIQRYMLQADLVAMARERL